MNTPLDASFPVLTEIISLPQGKSATPTPTPTPTPKLGAAEPKSESLLLQEQAIANWGDKEWDLLQQKLSERILRQLQGRIDFVLEQRVRDSLADVLQVAMAGLTAEIKRGLQHTMEDVIGRAVAQEITRLQTLKK